MPWFSRSKDKKKPTTGGGLFDGRRHRRSRAGDEDGSSKNNSRHSLDLVSEAGSGSGKCSRSPSPSSPSNSRGRHSHGQPLPLPCAPPMKPVERTYSGNQLPSAQTTSLHHAPSLPLPSPTQVVRPMESPAEADYISGSSSVSSLGSVEVADVRHGRPMPTNSNLRPMQQESEPLDQLRPVFQMSQGSATPRGRLVRNEPARIETPRSTSPLPGSHQPVTSPTSRAWSPIWQGEGLYPPAALKIPQPDSSMSSPAPSPRSFLPQQRSVEPLVSGSASPRSGNTSTYNSWQGDAVPPWPPSQFEERSPSPSPRLRSPGPSRTPSATVSPLHPRAGIRAGGGPDSPTTWHEEVQGRCPYAPQPLPLPPWPTGNNSPYTSPPVTSGPSTPTMHSRHPSRTNEPSRSADSSVPGVPTKWQKGRLLGSGTFGNVYVGFNNDNGGFCAMKEVLLVSDDQKSKESVKQLGQEISLLSKLRHENIVQYIGTETLEDRLYIYLEFVSGGSIHKLLQEYGAFKEPVVRNYTRQILSGLAYLHNQNTVHRDIKGANILVDTNGMVKLADFGMAKHISAQSFLKSFKGSPYWMAPEVLKHTGGYDLAVDIWSLGCTVLEMVTTKPPWHQYEGVAAMFKIGNSKELPAIPDSLSREGRDFVRLCLQRDPAHRPTAAQLLEHPFVQDAPRVCRPDDTLAGADFVPNTVTTNRAAVSNSIS
nr:mitogen-activated protein kinase kinase kinase YODA-like isoform X2 [Physcomitrium patens]|eukprot:XP_024382607.1 mitogen-activated protein kinase kinase kinase YODA-like isoform X2 [Physcomitrella patens]